MNIIRPALALLLSVFALTLQAQDNAKAIEKIYNEALTNGQCYQNLEYLATKIGARPAGSEEAAEAVEWSKQVMEKLGLDRVYVQEVTVPHWVRGDKEQARIDCKSLPSGSQEVHICALGGTVPTPENGLRAKVIEVQNFDELEKLGKGKVNGKIVFFNRPMEPSHVSTFRAYGGAVDQRTKGASEAAKYGAVGVIVRSMSLAHDHHPHTGAMHYKDGVEKVPAAAISTNDADILSSLLKKDPELQFYYKMNCQSLPPEKSYNVIGEIKGSEYPDEIITVGGHLDSWDMGQGAHDDGAGCVQSIEVLRIFKDLGIKPKRTIRAVMFMNEEFGLDGGTKYAEEAKNNPKERQYVAIESDAGGFSPRGFSIDTSEAMVQLIMDNWGDILKQYGLGETRKGGSGADIYTLKDQGAIAMGLIPDSQRYFDHHHSDTDTFDKINRRELELGAAALATMAYLFSENGIPQTAKAGK